MVFVLSLLCTMAAGEQTDLDRASRSSNVALRERPGGSGCVAGVPQPGHEYHVCLGPGPLCKGGEYLGGSGARPVCRYPATTMGYVVLVLLIGVLMFFESFRHWLLQLVPRSYLPVVQAIFGELSSLGFVSLVAFIFEGDSMDMGHELHLIFVQLHFLLFGVSMAFLCLSLLILFASLRNNRPNKLWSEQLEAGIQVLNLMPEVGKFTPETRWMHRQTLTDKMEIYLRIFKRFTDPETIGRGQVNVPPNANLAHYLTLQSSHTIATLTHIAALDWFLIAAIAGLQFFAWYFSAGLNPDAADGGLMIFIFFDILLAVLVFALDFKLHWIVTQLIPLSDVERHQAHITAGASLQSAWTCLMSGLSSSLCECAWKRLSAFPASSSRKGTFFALVSGSEMETPNDLLTPSRAGIVGKRGRLNRAFQDRYFVLMNGLLSYHETEEAFRTGSKPKGTLEVMGGRTVGSSRGSARTGFEWAFIDADNRCLECRSADARDRDQWIKAINTHTADVALSAKSHGKPVAQGVMRKRGRINRGFQDRFFVLGRDGTLSYYISEASFHMNWAPLGAIQVRNAQFEITDDMEGRGRNVFSGSLAALTRTLTGKGRDHKGKASSSEPAARPRREKKKFSALPGTLATSSHENQGESQAHCRWTLLEESTNRRLDLMCDTRKEMESWVSAMKTLGQPARRRKSEMGAGKRKIPNPSEQEANGCSDASDGRAPLSTGLVMANVDAQIQNAAATIGGGSQEVGLRALRQELQGDIADLEDRISHWQVLDKEAGVCNTSMRANTEKAQAARTGETKLKATQIDGVHGPALNAGGDLTTAATEVSGVTSVVSSSVPSPTLSLTEAWTAEDLKAVFSQAEAAAALSEVQMALELTDRAPIAGAMSASNSRRRMGSRLATERDAGSEGDQAGVPKHPSVVVQGKQFGSEEIRVKVDPEEASLGQDGAGLAGFEEIVEERTDGQCNVHPVQQSECSQNDSSRESMHRDHETMKRLQQARQAMIGADSQGRARKSSIPGFFKSTKVANMIERMATGAAEADDSMQVAFLATENSTVQRKSHLLPAYLTRPWADTRSNWRKTMGGHLINKHEQLFWLEKNGPKVAMRLIRHLLLGVIIIITAVIVVYRDTLLCAGGDGGESPASMESGHASLPRGRESCQTTGLGIFCFVLALIPPVLSTLLLPNIISNFVLATSLELLKSQQTLFRVVQDAKAKRTTHLFNTLVLVSSVIEQIDRLKTLAATAASHKTQVIAKAKPQMGYLKRGQTDFCREDGSGNQHVRDHGKIKDDAKFLKELDHIYETKAAESNALPEDRADEKKVLTPFRLIHAGKIKLQKILSDKAAVRLQQNICEDIEKGVTSTGVSRAEASGKCAAARSDPERNENLSKYQLQVMASYQEMFKMVDSAGSGELNQTQFNRFLLSTGVAVNAAQAKLVFEVVDIDSNGLVSWDEFARVMAAEMRHSTPKGVAQSTWLCFDPEGTGQVTAAQALAHLEKLKPGMDFGAVEELIHSVDVSRRGFITKAEYQVWVENLIREGSLKLNFH